MDRRSFHKVLLGGGIGTSLLLNSHSLLAKGFENVNPADYLKLPSNIRSIFDQPYPKFSDQEYARRKQALVDVMNAQEIDTILLVTSGGVGNATRWITNWPGTQQALTVFKPNQTSTMFVEYHNHVPLAKILARDTEVVWGGDKGMAPLMEFLGKQNTKKIGVIGPLVGPRWKILESKYQVVSLDNEYTKLRLIKSEEEISWLRVGAAMSDLGMAALVKGTRPGMTEHQLGDLIERTYIGLGGNNWIHYIGSTSMQSPDVCVPRQFTSRRKIQKGDFVFCELSASFWDYSGQVLRGFTVDAEPNSLYKDLHQTAYSAFNSITKVIRPGVNTKELIEASSIIEKNGFTTNDDMVHGYGGGYFAPILGSKSRPSGHSTDMELKENMCMVVQPNVITPDEKAGVQFGELIRVTKNGFESLHRTPHGLFKAGQDLKFRNT
jgi:Xaa-Pro aminopeptidase